MKLLLHVTHSTIKQLFFHVEQLNKLRMCKWLKLFHFQTHLWQVQFTMSYRSGKIYRPKDGPPVADLRELLDRKRAASDGNDKEISGDDRNLTGVESPTSSSGSQEFHRNGRYFQVSVLVEHVITSNQNHFVTISRRYTNIFEPKEGRWFIVLAVHNYYNYSVNTDIIYIY